MLLGELAGLASAALWAISSLIMAGLMRRMPALAVSSLRLVAGATFYVVLLLATGDAGGIFRLGAGTALGLCCSAIMAMGIGDTLYISGMRRIGVSKASPISVTSYPLLTVMLAWLVLGETVSVRMAAGTVLVLGGIVLVVVRPAVPPVPARADAEPESVPAGGAATVNALAAGVARQAAATRHPLSVPVQRSADDGSWLGVGLVLIAAVTWACSTIWLRRLTADANLIVVNSVRVPVVALLLGGVAASRGVLSPRRYRARDLFSISCAGVVGSGIGSLLYVYALREVGAGRSSLLNSLSPVFALPLAARMLGERITRLVVAGTVLALCGLWLVIG